MNVATSINNFNSIPPMRIRGRKPQTLGCPASLSSPSPSASPSPSSSISSYSSSLTACASSASSQDSSTSFPHPPSSHRWHGLDLLVKAIHQVTAGSVIGVPYVQRRVTIRRRRRRGLDSDAFVFDGLPQRRTSKRVSNSLEKKKKKQKMNKEIALQDPILHSWVARSNLAGEFGF